MFGPASVTMLPQLVILCNGAVRKVHKRNCLEKLGFLWGIVELGDVGVFKEACEVCRKRLREIHSDVREIILKRMALPLGKGRDGR